jgi:hypothetical protein
MNHQNIPASGPDGAISVSSQEQPSTDISVDLNAPKAPKLGLRAAINAMCKSCVYDPLSGMGTWRQQVEGCTVKVCALWPVRPRSTKH